MTSILTYSDQIYLLYYRFRSNVECVEKLIKEKNKEELISEIQIFLKTEYDIENEDAINDILELCLS